MKCWIYFTQLGLVKPVHITWLSKILNATKVMIKKKNTSQNYKSSKLSTVTK